MRILSNNVEGMNDSAKFHAVVNLARKYDVSMLQETKLCNGKMGLLRTKWKWHEGVFMSSVGARRGVITLFSERMRVEHLDHYEDTGGQFLLNVVLIEGKNFLFANVYGDPDLDRNSELTMIRLAERIEEIQRNFVIQQVVMGGDFNFVLEDRDTKSTSRKPRAEARFAALTEDLDLYDVDSMINDHPLHTYFRHRHEQRCSARYDRFYVTADLLQGAESHRESRTGDHTPIYIEVMAKPKGRGHWRFDDRLLTKASEVARIQEVISRVLRTRVNDDGHDISVTMLQEFVDFQEHCPLDLLSEILCAVTRTMKEVMNGRKEAAKQIEKETIQNLIQARREMNQSGSEESIRRFEDAREELRMKQSMRASAADDANFVQYATAGERMTRYHFQIMGKGKASREIRRIKQGDQFLEGEEVARCLSEKFAAIAAEDPNVGGVSIEDYLGRLGQGVRKVPEDMKERLNRRITENEVETVIRGLKVVSSPGPSGITNELLKNMLPCIKTILVNAGNKLLFEDLEEVPEWLFHRKVIFILKPGRSEDDCDSYRGLSMLENVFKLYAKILGDRMAKVLKTVQDRHQFGFTEGKSCSEPTRAIIDVMTHAKQTGLPLIVISTDIFKAFDTINLGHMGKCLEYYGFPEEYSRAFMRLVHNGTMEFEVNGILSQKFKLERGTGQGDPKSCYAYNLCVTPLNDYLSRDDEVPRYKVEDQEINPVYFADDNCMMFKGDNVESIVRVVNKIAAYEQVSGLKLNPSKCEIIAMNCDEESVVELTRRTGMKRVQKMKHLGVWINEEGEATEEDNLKPICEHMEGLVKRYATSGSTPIGRSLYAKFLLGQRYVHRLQNTLISEEMAEEMSGLLRRMTWTRTRMTDGQVGVRTHIAKGRVNQPVSYGGLSLPDPKHQNLAIRLTWIRKFGIEYSDQGWYKVVQVWLNECGRPSLQNHMALGKYDWRKTSEALENRSSFWAQVFNAGARIQEMAMAQMPEWHMVPLIGECEGQRIVTYAALEYENPIAKIVVRHRLRNVGQLFKVNEAGLIQPNQMKTLEEVQDEFQCMDEYIWNSAVSFVNSIKRKYQDQVQSGLQRLETRTILESIVNKYKKGCSIVTGMLLREERGKWTYGEVPRAYMTYVRDNITDIDSGSFMAAFYTVRETQLKPSIQWTSTQVLLRTLWTRVKERKTLRG